MFQRDSNSYGKPKTGEMLKDLLALYRTGEQFTCSRTGLLFSYNDKKLDGTEKWLIRTAVSILLLLIGNIVIYSNLS